MYSNSLGSNLVSLISKHRAVFEADKTAEISKVLPKVLAQSQTTLYEFDDRITCLVGGSSPPFPLPSAQAYYKWASCHTMVADILVPYLALNADDDPIVGVLPVHTGIVQSPWVVFGLTQKGGHLAWFEKGSTRDHPRRWYRRPVLEWLKTMGEDVVHEDRLLPAIREVDGYLREEGRDHLGCKVVEGGGHVIGVEGEGGLLAGL